ncbi:MAG: hypothetical protein H7A22_15630 [Spirochaetales bacterium]|nr:hypothetical protein [Spirochaetales bacterium]
MEPILLTDRLRSVLGVERFEDREESLVQKLRSTVSAIKDTRVLEDLYAHFASMPAQFSERKNRFDGKLSATIGIVTFLISLVVAYLLYLLDKKVFALRPGVLVFLFAASLLLLVFAYLILLLRPESGFVEPRELEVIHNAVSMKRDQFRTKQIILLAYVSSKNFFILEGMERRLKLCFYALLVALVLAIPGAISSGAALPDAVPAYFEKPIRVQVENSGADQNIP